MFLLPLLPSFLPSRSLPLLIDQSIQRAIDIAIESFPELRDVERDRICLEVRVMHSHQRTVEVGRSAWPFLVPTLARFDIVDVCVAPPPTPRTTMSASPSSVVESTHYASASSSVFESTPRVSERGLPEYSDPQSNFVAHGARMPSSLSPSQFLTTRVVVDLVPSKSSRGRHSPQPSQYHRF